ncbi:MAG: GLPGLI family protein [Bacteroidetes bacterium]|nr:GLPGLI family protein [Bacteroidota bacterium]
MTRLFREKTELSKIKWKMGIASKEILGYTCMLAETELDDQKIMAWFTPDIPISAGPECYYGLPGLMLEVNVNQGQIVWMASQVDLTIPNIAFLDEPKEGKKVTAEQYQQIQDEKIAEWEQQQNKKKKNAKVIK